MDIRVETLDAKLREWRPELAKQVRQRIAEIIELADQDALNLIPSRNVEQDVLNILDGEIERGVAEADRGQLIVHDDAISELRDRLRKHRR
jgi:predicted transcriptional regulator